MMRTMLSKAPTSISAHVLTSELPSASKSQPTSNDNPPARQHVSFAHLTGYDSDESSEEDDTDGESEDRPVKVTNRLPVVPPLKRQKLAVPYREQRKQRQKQRVEEYRKVLTDVDKLLLSNKTIFVAGTQGLQVHRMRAIASHLKMVVQNGRKWEEASERSAETYGFAVKWGGRQLHGWSCKWIKTRELLKSLKGRHVKVYLLLSDPIVAVELRAYAHSNKWAMNLAKLAEFSQKQLVDTAADKYLSYYS
jgi:predicted transcriptional regulator